MIFKFVITGREEQVIGFEKELLDVLLRVVGDNEMLAHEIHFCVHEAILNVIQHTYRWDLDQPLDIQVNINETSENSRVLEIIIKDSGKPIDKPIAPPRQIDQFQLRKRGLYMIGKIMDDFQVKPMGKTGNMAYMKKIIPILDNNYKEG